MKKSFIGMKSEKQTVVIFDPMRIIFDTPKINVKLSQTDGYGFKERVKLLAYENVGLYKKYYQEQMASNVKVIRKITSEKILGAKLKPGALEFLESLQELGEDHRIVTCFEKEYKVFNLVINDKIKEFIGTKKIVHKKYFIPQQGEKVIKSKRDLVEKYSKSGHKVVVVENDIKKLDEFYVPGMRSVFLTQNDAKRLFVMQKYKSYYEAALQNLASRIKLEKSIIRTYSKPNKTW